MNTHNHIDTTFDFRTDTPEGKDPDSHSPTLRAYHKRLWSKPLPGGVVFDLVDTVPKVYLYHQSEMGKFSLSSDAVVPSFRNDSKIKHIIPVEVLDAFNAIGYTIGGMMIFPEEKIERKMTINGARGFHPRIKDRFDFTVECIRRHYLGAKSPLSDVLARYANFFRLFEDFRGYVEFFLLQDLVAENYSAVKFFTPFDDFATSPPLPSSKEAYMGYKQRAIEFIEACNRRILQSFEQ